MKSKSGDDDEGNKRQEKKIEELSEVPWKETIS